MTTTRSLLRLALAASTATAALLATPAAAQNLPDTGNVAAVTRGLGGNTGPTTPTFTVNSNAIPRPELRVGLRDNRTILTWRGTGFDISPMYTVRFIDDRATTGVTNRTANIAVLNRDLSGSASSIGGQLFSSDNIAVLLINPSGINFGSNSAGQITTGSFIASTNDLSNDDDFLNAATSLRFTRQSAGPGRISSAGIGISAFRFSTSTDGGRLGDVVLIADEINVINFGSGIIEAQGGDAALLAARDVTVQFTPGSPLAFTINQGSASTSSSPLSVAQNVSARNVTLGLFSSGVAGPALNLQVNGTLTATGAAVTDRGVVLVADAAAPGVTLNASPLNPIGLRAGITLQNAVTSSTNIYLANGASGAGPSILLNQFANPGAPASNGSLNAAQLLNINTRNFNASALGNTIRAGSLNLVSTNVTPTFTAIFNGSVTTTTGDLSINGTGSSVTFGNGATIAGSLSGNFGSLLLTGSTGLSAGTINVTANVNIGVLPLISAGNLTINGSATGSILRSTSGDVVITTGAGGVINLSVVSGRAITLTSATNFTLGTVTGTGAVTITTTGTTPGTNNSLGGVDTNGDVLIRSRNSLTGASFGSPVGTIRGRDVTLDMSGAANSVTLSTVNASGALAITAGAITAQSLSATGGNIGLTANSNINVTSGLNASGGITATAGATGVGGSISLTNAVTGTGDLAATGQGTSGNTIILNGATVGRDLRLQATGFGSRITLQNGFAVSGAATVNGTGGTVEFGTSTNSNFTYRANGQLSVTAAQISSLNTGSPITIMANALGATVNPATLDLYIGAGGLGNLALAANTMLMGGPARQSDVRLRVESATAPVTFGGLSARSLQGAIGPSAAFTPGLTTTGTITTGGAWTLTNPLALSGQSLALNAVTVTNGGLTLRAAGNGATPGLTLNSALNASGDLVARTDTGNLTLGANARLTGATVSLATPANFINQTTITTSPITGRWAIYAGTPTGNVFGNGNLFSNNTAIWNGTIDTRQIAGLTGNRFVFAFRPTLTITPTDFSKVYGTDLTGAGASIPFTVSGLQTGFANAFLADTAATALSGAPSFTSAGFAPRASVAGGPYAVTAGLGTLTSPNGYAIALGVPARLTVTPLGLTGTVVANSKTYDGTTTGTGSVTLNGVVTGDTVGTTGTTFTFADKNAGLGKMVTIAGTTLTGADAGNYTLTVPATAFADILRAVLTGTVSVNNKTYDGTTAATGGVTLNGVIAGDDVGSTGTTFTFADKNAGLGKMVTIAGTTLTGADAGNYTLTVPATAFADILRAVLTGTVSVNNKTYDGTTAATGSVTLNGVIAGDDVGSTGTTFTFADKNAGTGKTVTIAGTTLTGADAGNYELTLPATAFADILRAALTGTVTVNNKTYDGTRNATGSVTLNGVVAGDQVGTSGTTFTFADKNAGAGKTVAVAGTTLTGADAGNYTLTVPATALADILRAALTGTVRVNNKTYDGTRNATGAVTLNGVVAGDQVGTSGTTFTFSDKNAGTGKTVAVAGTTLTGADAGNYTLTVPATALADILRAALSATVRVNNKTYDGNRNATGTVTLNGVVAGDQVVALGTNFTFSDKNAGTGKTVAVAGTTLAGVDAGNYTLTVPATALADILRAALTGNVTVNAKTYDGTRTGSGSVTLNGVVAGDQVGTSGTSFTFASANAGTGISVAVAGTMLTGIDAGNYTLSLPATVLGTINRRAITVTANNASKPQGSVDPLLTYRLTNGSLVAGDTLTGAITRAPGEIPGNYAILLGTLAASANYTLSFVPGTFTITRVGDTPQQQFQTLQAINLPNVITVPPIETPPVLTLPTLDLCAGASNCAPGY